MNRFVGTSHTPLHPCPIFADSFYPIAIYICICVRVYPSFWETGLCLYGSLAFTLYRGPFLEGVWSVSIALSAPLSRLLLLRYANSSQLYSSSASVPFYPFHFIIFYFIYDDFSNLFTPNGIFLIFLIHWLFLPNLFGVFDFMFFL